MPRLKLIQIRGGTASAWTTANPVLASREMGVETDTRKHKFGDGVTAWSSLSYAGGAGTNEVGFTDLGTGSGTLDLNFGGNYIMVFRGQTSFATAKNITLSFTSNALKFDFSFEISNVAATLTFPSGFMGDTSDTRWDSSLHRWTSDLAIGVFKVIGTFDGINWLLEFSKAPYA